jgi:hypothetical protein
VSVIRNASKFGKFQLSEVLLPLHEPRLDPTFPRPTRRPSSIVGARCRTRPSSRANTDLSAMATIDGMNRLTAATSLILHQLGLRDPVSENWALSHARSQSPWRPASRSMPTNGLAYRREGPGTEGDAVGRHLYIP